MIFVGFVEELNYLPFPPEVLLDLEAETEADVQAEAAAETSLAASNDYTSLGWSESGYKLLKSKFSFKESRLGTLGIVYTTNLKISLLNYRKTQIHQNQNQGSRNGQNGNF